MTNTTLYMVRHGETEANVKKQIVGIQDTGLTDTGIRDAHFLGANIKRDIDLIITSPQKRSLHTADIIRKYYCNVPIIEHPLLYPQNFGIIEGHTLEEATKRGLGKYLHTENTNRYTHKVPGGESTQEMELRIFPEISAIGNLLPENIKNILCVSHNSILRSIVGNIYNISPHQWIHSHFGKQQILDFSHKKIYNIFSQRIHSYITDLLHKYFDEKNNHPKGDTGFREKLALLSLHEEEQVYLYLMEQDNKKHNSSLGELINTVKHTLDIRTTRENMNTIIHVPGVYGLLSFGSGLYGRNYNIHQDTDIDVEIIFDENFDIDALEKTLFMYYLGDIQKDFGDFIQSKADYFVCKTVFLGKEIDIRITHKKCFEKICTHSLEKGDEYILKEFRKQWRENGSVSGRKNFLGHEVQWDNHIEYTQWGQIIYYPLFQYLQDEFVIGNNIDKYCSFVDVHINEILIKQQIFTLRRKFNQIFQKYKCQDASREHLDIVNIFSRKERFPKFLLEDLHARYDIYSHLFSHT